MIVSVKLLDSCLNLTSCGGHPLLECATDICAPARKAVRFQNDLILDISVYETTRLEHLSLKVGEAARLEDKYWLATFSIIISVNIYLDKTINCFSLWQAPR